MVGNFHKDQASQYRDAVNRIPSGTKLEYDKKKTGRNRTKDAIITFCVFIAMIVAVLLLGRLLT